MARSMGMGPQAYMMSALEGILTDSIHDVSGGSYAAVFRSDIKIPVFLKVFPQKTAAVTVAYNDFLVAVQLFCKLQDRRHADSPAHKKGRLVFIYFIKRETVPQDSKDINGVSGAVTGKLGRTFSGHPVNNAQRLLFLIHFTNADRAGQKGAFVPGVDGDKLAGGRFPGQGRPYPASHKSRGLSPAASILWLVLFSSVPFFFLSSVSVRNGRQFFRLLW